MDLCEAHMPGLWSYQVKSYTSFLTWRTRAEMLAAVFSYRPPGDDRVVTVLGPGGFTELMTYEQWRQELEMPQGTEVLEQ